MRIYADGFLYFNAREEEVLRCMIRSRRIGHRDAVGGPGTHRGIYDVAQKVQGRLVRIAAEKGGPAAPCFAAAPGKTGRCGSASSGAGFFRGTRSPLARRRMPFACAQQRTPMSRWNMRRHRSARCFALDSAAAGIFWCAPAICPIMRLPLKMCLNAMRSQCF